MGVLIDTGVFIHWERLGGSFDIKHLSLDGEALISVVTASELQVREFNIKQ